MRHGKNCSAKLVTLRLAKYRFDLGLDDTQICDAAEGVVCHDCRRLLEVKIPGRDELIAAAAIARVKIPVKLNAREIRFLRKALGWQSKTMARQLSVDLATVSRWESCNGAQPIAPNNEKLLRLFVAHHLRDKAPGVLIDGREILTMELPAARQPGEKVPLDFRRVMSKRSRKADAIEVWDVRPLVVHYRNDRAVPFEARRELAAVIRGARFVPWRAMRTFSSSTTRDRFGA